MNDLLTTLLTTLNFAVRIELENEREPLCQAAFAECSGLEAGIDVKTIRQGGDNERQIHLMGRVTYGTLSLKRGMTADFGLWRWLDQVVREGQTSLRATTTVDMLTTDRRDVAATFRLDGCLPTKLRAPSLSAKEGVVAVEELEVSYERLTLGGGS